MSVETTPCGLQVTLDLSMEEARARVTEALKAQGFGVLTEIDVKGTLKEKIGEDFRSYTILGACNPKLAHRALSTRLDVGLLLPCNVTLWETDDGRVTVSAVDPKPMLEVAGTPELAPVAEEARAGLLAALEATAG
jgi:uncharacterized protein (DUF302 family)